tara:strand:+ start:15365 stop:16606 length:1242 start_codon:yes stop_codon:yes gene_type:complete
MNRVPIKLGLIAVLALGACGGGDDDNEAGADAAPNTSIDAGVAFDAEPSPDAAPLLTPLEEFCAPEGAFDQLFATLRECGGFLRSIEINGTDLLTGESLQALCVDQYAAMVADGSLTIDRDALAACSAYATTTSCQEIASFDYTGTPCEDVLVGTVPLAGDCDVSEQCVGQAFCDQGKADCGACTARLDDDVACNFDDQCNSGLCNSQNVCAAPAALGGACATNSDCAGTLECDQGNVCISRLPAQGDPCFSQGDCAGPDGGIPFDIGLYCEPSGQKSPGTCEVVPAIGEACLPQAILEIPFDIDQDVCNIHAYEWCSEGTCTAPTISAVGGPCNLFAVTGSGARRCDSGLICSNPGGGIEGPIGVCQVPGDVGDTCSEPSQEMPGEPCLPFFACQQGVCQGSNEYSGMCPAP